MVALELFFHPISSWRYYYHAYIAHRIMVTGIDNYRIEGPEKPVMSINYFMCVEG
jgi:hypothetical protein